MGKPVRHRNKWRIRWTDAQGHRKSEVYLSKQDADFRLKQHLLEAEEVRRGLRRAAPPAKRFRELCDYWLEHRASRKRSGRDDRYIIERYFRPRFGDLHLTQLTVEETDKYVLTLQHLAPKTIANHLTILIAMLNAAVDIGWLDKVPRIKKPKTVQANDFRYLRTMDEIRQFLRAARVEGEHVYALYATAIYTGMRAGELAGLLWDDVDFDRRLIQVQRSFNGPTKSGKFRVVPILEPLLSVLREWRLKHPGRLVFANRDGNMLRPCARVFEEVLHRVLEAAEFPTLGPHGEEQRYITFHGLRHTFASHWVMAGGSLFKLQKILGHGTVQMTMRYAHLQPDVFSSDYEILGEAPPIEADVIELSSKRRCK